jgi:hypothetical protein
MANLDGEVRPWEEDNLCCAQLIFNGGLFLEIEQKIC